QRDARRDQVREARIGASEHDVLAGRLEIVVLDEKRSRTVPPEYRLRILVQPLEVREIRVDDARVAAVESEASALAVRRVAVEVAAIHLEVPRRRGERALGRPGAGEFH